jgi:hypothetical protein
MPVAQGGLTFLFGNGAASATWQLLFYLTGNFAPGSGHQALQVAGAAPPPATGGARWVVGTLTPTKYARPVLQQQDALNGRLRGHPAAQ